MDDTAATIVLVHGAWGTPDDWDDVAGPLSDDGLAVVVADLPTMGSAAATLDDDVTHVAGLLDAVDGPVVLCGHSYGGMVITAAAAGRAAQVTHLVYLAALVPDVGESMRSLTSGAHRTGPDDEDEVASSGMVAGTDGTTTLDDWAADDWDYPADALQRMRRHQRRPFAAAAAVTPVSAAAWTSVPSTYVVAERDASIPAERQRRLAERTSRVVEVDSGHMVQFEHPTFVAALLAEVAGGV